jgi:WD40 repeat protein/energy-coupling factor transporter ATP-binding protein EcfA2
MARYALVVGITQYDYPYNFPNLTKPASDAEAVARLLEERGGFQKIVRLPEGWNYERGCSQVAADRLTSEQFVQALRTFLEEVDGGDALIYFSGHGFVVADKLNQWENLKKGYLVTSDSQIETIAVHGIPFDSLNTLFRKSKLNSLVLLLDCCHAGSYLERDLVEQTLTAFGSQKDYYLIAACRATEKAYEGEPEQDNSVFTEALLEGLAQERADNDGQISCDRLFDYIYKSKKPRNFGQVPIRLGLGGSITLVTYPIDNKEPLNLNRQNPYQGLRAFESEQARYFYGREQAVRELLVRLHKDRFVSVIGPSGSGKSSLVKAGLFPQLRNNRISESSNWEIESFTPGKYPLTPLMEILARQHRRNQPYVLFIDQFEEVFTLCEKEDDRRTFMQLITEEATNTEPLARVIVAIRGDFLDRCAAYPEPATLINSTETRPYMVTPLSLAELEEAIEKPAVSHGVMFERGLVSQILEDVDDQPGALPLLQYALSQLWRVCVEKSSSEQPQLTKKGYEEIGGVKGALNETANTLYHTRVPEDQAFIRDLFMQLVQVEEDKVTRRPISWERLEAIANSPEQGQRVVGLLADQRLLVTDEKNVQVVHEALLSEWTLLRKWIEDNREDIRLSRRLEAYCREWQERFNQSEKALLPDAWLAPIEDWVKRTKHKLKLTPQEAEYLHRSIGKRDQEAEAKLKQERKLREAAEDIARAEKQRTFVAAGAGVVVAVLFAFLGLIQVRKVQEAKMGEANAWLASAEAYFNTTSQLEALISSVKALQVIKGAGIKDIEDPKIIAKFNKVIYGVYERNQLTSGQAAVIGISIRHDGEIIAASSASDDKNIQLWTKEGKRLESLDGQDHTGWVSNVRFSPNGELLASAGYDKRIKLWHIDKTGKGKLIHDFIGHKDRVYDINFSNDGSKIASSSRDGTIKLWTKEGQPLKTLSNRAFHQGQGGGIFSIDFHPNGSMLASSGYQEGNKRNGNVYLWSLLTTGVQQPIALGQPTDQHQDIVYIVKFSPKGNILASGSQDGTVKLWDIKPESGKLIGTIDVNQHESLIYGLGFNKYGNVIATASDDGTIKLWNVNEAKKWWDLGRKLTTPIETLKGHTKFVNRVEFSPQDDKRLVSAGDDGFIRLWEVDLNRKNKMQPISNPDSLLKDSCNFTKDYITLNPPRLLELKTIPEFCKRYNLNLSSK